MTKLDLEMKKQKLEKELAKLAVYQTLRERLESEIQWRFMEYHPADDEHADSWYTEPEADSYKYEDYQLANDILDALDKVIAK